MTSHQVDEKEIDVPESPVANNAGDKEASDQDSGDSDMETDLYPLLRRHTREHAGTMSGYL